MRTFLLAVASAIAFVSPASAATRNFGITDFTKVRVDGPYNVTLVTGVAPFARAIGSTTAIDRVAIDVRGDTLIVHSNVSSWSSDPGANSGPVEVSIGTHDLTNAWLNGAGSLNIDRVKGLTFGLSVQGSGSAQISDVSVDQLSVSVIGSASAVLGGSAKKLTAIVRGISSVDATHLTAADATIGAEGTATIDANVTNSANISASGNATIRFAGRPSCTVKANGPASISGCR
jgi:hypothetical protein